MNYVLVENQTTVLLGPITWKARFIQSELDDLEVDYTLSPTEPNSYLRISDTIEIYPVPEYVTPDFDPVYQHLAGPFWTFENQTASATFDVLDRPIDWVKGDLKGQVAQERYNRQIKGTTVDINSQTISVGTDTESLNKYVGLLNAIGVNDTINYKSNVGFITLGKTDLQNIVDTINTYIQTQFNWELSTGQTIDEASDVVALKSITIVEPVTPGV